MPSKHRVFTKYVQCCIPSFNLSIRIYIYIYMCVYQYPWGVQASKLCLFSMNEIHNPGFDVQHDRRPFRDRLSRRKFPVAGPLPVTLAAQKRWNCPCHVGLWIFWSFKSVVWGLLEIRQVCSGRIPHNRLAPGIAFGWTVAKLESGEGLRDGEPGAVASQTNQLGTVAIKSSSN